MHCISWGQCTVAAQMCAVYVSGKRPSGPKSHLTCMFELTLDITVHMMVLDMICLPPSLPPSPLQASTPSHWYPVILPDSESSYNGQCVNDVGWGLSLRQGHGRLPLHHIRLPGDVWVEPWRLLTTHPQYIDTIPNCCIMPSKLLSHQYNNVAYYFCVCNNVCVCLAVGYHRLY